MRVNFILLTTLIFLSVYIGIDRNIKRSEINFLNNNIVAKNKEIERGKNKLILNLNNNKIVLEYGENYKNFAVKLEKFEEIDFVVSLAGLYGHDWKYFVCQIYYESEFDENALSHKNAKGLMQLTKYVYKDIDPYSSIDNIMVGITYWDYLYNQYNDLSEEDRILYTFAAYNCGITRVNNIKKKYKIKKYSELKNYLPKETRKYIKNIINLYDNIS